MPELPDVQVFKEYLDATALHQRVVHLDVRHRKILDGVSKDRLARTIEGQAFEGACRHGKHLFVHLTGGRWLHLHFGMTGRLLYYKDAQKEPAHARVVWSLASGYHLALDCQRLLGSVALSEDPDKTISDKRLGPDALDLKPKDFVRRLEKKRGSLKRALMDQSVVAGLGNIYTDEILFHAHLRPDRRLPDLDTPGRERLWRVALDVLHKAIEARAEVARMPSSWLLPHRSEDARCPACGGRVSSKKVSGRRSYFCTSCQK